MPTLDDDRVYKLLAANGYHWDAGTSSLNIEEEEIDLFDNEPAPSSGDGSGANDEAREHRSRGTTLVVSPFLCELAREGGDGNKDGNGGDAKGDSAKGDAATKAPAQRQSSKANNPEKADRDEPSADIERLIRPFRFEISDVAMKLANEAKLPFIRLELGGFIWKFPDATEVYDATKDENQQPVEEAMPVLKAELIGDRQFKYSKCHRAPATGSFVDVPELEWSGVFRGSYRDLKLQGFRAQVWDRVLMGTNTLLGMYESKLEAIAQSSVEQTFDLTLPHNAKETTVTLRMRFQLSEVSELNVSTSEWNLTSNRPDAPKFKKPRLGFALQHIAPRCEGLKRTLLKCIPGGSDVLAMQKDNAIPAVSAQAIYKDDTTPNESSCVLSYEGTRGDLENESFVITLESSGVSSMCRGRKPIKIVAPIQGAIDYGVWEFTFSDGDESITCTGALKFESAGPRFRQAGDTNVGGDMIVHIVCASNLRGSQENLKPSVEVIWCDQTKRTEPSTGASPEFNSKLGFRIEEDLFRNEKAFTEAAKTVLQIRILDTDGSATTEVGSLSLGFGAVLKQLAPDGSKSMEFETTMELRSAVSTGTDAHPKLKFKIIFPKGIDYQVPGKAMADVLDTIPDPVEGSPGDGSEQRNASELVCSEEYEKGRISWQEATDRIVRDMELFGRSCAVRGRHFASEGRHRSSSKLYWLPEFVSSITPPGSVKTDGHLLNYILGFETTGEGDERRFAFPPTSKQMRVKVMLEQEPGPRSPSSAPLPIRAAAPVGSQSFNNSVNSWSESSWADPQALRDSHQGVVNDRALLLCCMLLAQGLDAYVCVGSCLAGATRTVRRHYWVMTRETSTGLPTPVHYVRFWETSIGSCTILQNGSGGEPRWRPDFQAADRAVAAGGDIGEEGEGDLGYDNHTRLPVEERFSMLDDLEEATKQTQRARRNAFRQRMRRLAIAGFDGSAQGTSGIPYCSIDVVFNDSALFANIQHYDPRRIAYNFDDPDRWNRFTVSRGDGVPFYGKGSVSRAPADADVNRARNCICRTIKNAVVQRRQIDRSLGTNFISLEAHRVFQDRLDLMRTMLDMNSVFANADEGVVEWREAIDRTSGAIQDWAGDESKAAHGAFSNIIEQATSKFGMQFVDRVLRMPYIDVGKVTTQVLERCAFMLQYALRPEFVCAVHVRNHSTLVYFGVFFADNGPVRSQAVTSPRSR